MTPQLILIRGGLHGDAICHAKVGEHVMKRDPAETLAEFEDRVRAFAENCHATTAIIGGLPED